MEPRQTTGRTDGGAQDQSQPAVRASRNRSQRTAASSAEQDQQAQAGAVGAVDGRDLLLALTTLRQVRDQLAGWEPLLIGAARDEGLTWAQIAPALGLASRQAAERRYLRLNPTPADTPRSTREHRVQATRDSRSGTRAVAAWARQNAADLRRLAGQITALHGLNPSARARVNAIHTALGGNDAADLIDPLSAAQPSLRHSHPALAEQLIALDHATADIRSQDQARRYRSQAPD